MPRLRKYVSEFQVRVGPINVIGALIKLTKTDADEYKEFVSVCPDCEEPTKPKQGYTCEAGHGPYTIGELTKAKDLGDGVLAKVTNEDYLAARTSTLPINIFTANVHPVEQFTDATYYADNAYVFVPNSPDEYYALLVRLVRESGKAFVAMANVRHNEALYRLTYWNGNVVLQKMLWPDALNEFAPIDSTCEDTLYNAAVGMVDRVTNDFSADNYQSQIKERLIALAEALSNGTTPRVETTPEPTAPSQSLLEALNAFTA